MSDAHRKLDDAQRNAEAAQALLDNPVLASCLAGIRDDALTAFERSAPEAGAAREEAYRMLRALRELEARIKDAADDAKVVERNLRSRLR